VLRRRKSLVVLLGVLALEALQDGTDPVVQHGTENMLPAVRAELTVEIARAPEEVFSYLTDVSNLPLWQSGVSAATLEGEPAAGALIHESRHMLGRELRTTLEIDECERPRLFTLRALNSPVPFTVRHELEPSAAGTKLTVVGEGDAGLLPGFAAGIMARRAEKQFRKDFERLKRLLES
jgi:carbon monoxide dehydrogenase subunit G